MAYAYLPAAVLAYISFSFIITRFYQTKGLKLYYMNDKKKNGLICKIAEESKLKSF